MSSTEHHGGATRERLVARWLELTRDVLPSMAADAKWPIRLDHCFMRVCLDTAFGAPWTRYLRRPAIVHMTTPQLLAAIAVADHIATRPSVLRDLNARSIEARRSQTTP